MKKKSSLLFLILMISSLFSCSNRSGIHQGQSTPKAFKLLESLKVPYSREKDFTWFQYENRNYVLQQTSDYHHIKKVKDYAPVTPSLSDFDRLKSGMDLFDVVALYGLPYTYGSGSITVFAFMTKEQNRKLVFFRADNTQIHKTC